LSSEKSQTISSQSTIEKDKLLTPKSRYVSLMDKIVMKKEENL